MWHEVYWIIDLYVSARASLWKPMNQITVWQVKHFQKHQFCKVSSSEKYPRWHVTSLRFLFSLWWSSFFPCVIYALYPLLPVSTVAPPWKIRAMQKERVKRTGSVERVGWTERGGRFVNTSQACLCVWILVCWRWDNRRAQLVWCDPAWQKVKGGETCIKAPIRKFNRIKEAGEEQED